MVAWTVCGILGVIILVLLFLLGWWKHTYYKIYRYGNPDHEWLVFEKDGLVRYSHRSKFRLLRPPKTIRTRVIEEKKKKEDEDEE